MINFVSLSDSPPAPLALFTVASGGEITLHRKFYTEEEIKYMRDSFKKYPKHFKDKLESELRKLYNEIK